MTQTLRRAAGLLLMAGLFSAIGYAVGWWLFVPKEGAAIGALLGVLAGGIAALSGERRVGARLRKRLARMEQTVQAVQSIDQRSRENRDILEQLADVLHEHATVLDSLSAPVPAVSPRHYNRDEDLDSPHSSPEDPPIFRSSPDTPPPGMMNTHSDEDDLYHGADGDDVYAGAAARRAEAAIDETETAIPAWMHEAETLEDPEIIGPLAVESPRSAALKADVPDAGHALIGPAGPIAEEQEAPPPRVQAAVDVEESKAETPDSPNAVDGALADVDAAEAETLADEAAANIAADAAAASPAARARPFYHVSGRPMKGPSIEIAHNPHNLTPAAVFITERRRDEEPSLNRDYRLLERLPDMTSHLTQTYGDIRIIACVDALSASRPQFVQEIIRMINSYPDIDARLSIGIDAEDTFRNPDIQDGLEALKPYGRRLALMNCHDGAGRLTLIARQPVSHLIADPQRLLRNLKTHRVAPDRFQELLGMRGVTLGADHVNDEAARRAALEVGAAMVRGAAAAAAQGENSAA